MFSILFLPILSGWFILSCIVCWYGIDRKIGASASFFISLLFSPIIGFICVALSERVSKEPEPALVAAPVQQVAEVNVLDELTKLGALKEKGILTDEEFQEQKSKLLKA
ncbi:MAG: SHOCT domain-containing protein [Bacteroidetes bacterium]|nr:SHOCT domain-containing protein [Bacteroidota bacterium]